jgi:hypothetical protein
VLKIGQERGERAASARLHLSLNSIDWQQHRRLHSSGGKAGNGCAMWRARESVVRRADALVSAQRGAARGVGCHTPTVSTCERKMQDSSFGFVAWFEKGLNNSRAEEISWSSGRDTSTDTLSTICYVYRAHASCKVSHSYVVLGAAKTCICPM